MIDKAPCIFHYYFAFQQIKGKNCEFQLFRIFSLSLTKILFMTILYEGIPTNTSQQSNSGCIHNNYILKCCSNCHLSFIALFQLLINQKKECFKENNRIKQVNRLSFLELFMKSSN